MNAGVGLFELSGSTSTAMVRGMRARDPAAWKRMTSYYSPLVYNWCRRGGLRPSDAADVMQEVFLAVWQALDGFWREEPGQTFRGWLRTIARNKIADHFRGILRRPQVDEAGSAVGRLAEPVELSADETADRAELKQLFDRAMQTVRDEFEAGTWQAFMLSTLENRPAADVAQELGMSPGAVRQAKYKVLRRLREELGEATPPGNGVASLSGRQSG